MHHPFTETDILLFQKREKALNDAVFELETLKKGAKCITIDAPATVNNK